MNSSPFNRPPAYIRTPGLGEVDPLGWWNAVEVNIFGVYNFVRPALKHLEKSNGYALVVSTVTAQLRFPGKSEYGGNLYVAVSMGVLSETYSQE